MKYHKDHKSLEVPYPWYDCPRLTYWHRLTVNWCGRPSWPRHAYTSSQIHDRPVPSYLSRPSPGFSGKSWWIWICYILPPQLCNPPIAKEPLSETSLRVHFVIFWHRFPYIYIQSVKIVTDLDQWSGQIFALTLWTALDPLDDGSPGKLNGIWWVSVKRK